MMKKIFEEPKMEIVVFVTEAVTAEDDTDPTSEIPFG